MIISDLSYLQDVSEVPNIVGGARENKITVKQKTKVTFRNSIGGSVTATNESSVVSSNDNL